jgi:DNA transposition AAA+ family ATPase
MTLSAVAQMKRGALTEAPLTTEAQVAETRLRAVRHHEDNPGLSQTKTARLIGIGAATYSQWLNEKYAGDNADVARKVSRYLSTFAQQRAAQGDFTYVQTSVDERIVNSIERAKATRKISLIQTESGVGASVTLSNYAAENDCPLLECDPSMANPWPLLTALQRVVLGPSSRLRSNDAFEAIVTALRGTSRTILVDEAHYLHKPECFDLLRRASDRGNVGLVIVGNANRFQGRAANAGSIFGATAYTQFKRRVIARQSITADSITANDLRMVLGQSLEPALLEETIEKWLHVAHNHGGVGRCTTLLQDARMNAAPRALAVKHIFRAIEDEGER